MESDSEGSFSSSDDEVLDDEVPDDGNVAYEEELPDLSELPVSDDESVSASYLFNPKILRYELSSIINEWQSRLQIM